MAGSCVWAEKEATLSSKGRVNTVVRPKGQQWENWSEIRILLVGTISTLLDTREVILHYLLLVSLQWSLADYCSVLGSARPLG